MKRKTVYCFTMQSNQNNKSIFANNVTILQNYLFEYSLNDFFSDETGKSGLPSNQF